MKKLTTSMFAILVGLAAADANAAITSKAYVDDAIKSVNSNITTNVSNLTEQITNVAGDVTTLENTVTQQATTIEKLVATEGEGSVAQKIADALADYTDTAGMEAKIGTAKTEAIEAAKTAGDAAYAVKATEGIADTASKNASQALTNIGTLGELKTTDKTSVVGALNSLKTETGANAGLISDLQTEVSNIKSGDSIGDGVINNDKLANDAVTTDKIKNGAVTGDKIGAGAVGTTQIANGAVTTEKLADVVEAGTASKVTYNSKGQITGKAELTAADIKGLKLLATAEVPAGCDTGTCVLKFDGTKYSWENIAETYNPTQTTAE